MARGFTHGRSPVSRFKPTTFLGFEVGDEGSRNGLTDSRLLDASLTLVARF